MWEVIEISEAPLPEMYMVRHKDYIGDMFHLISLHEANKLCERLNNQPGVYNRIVGHTKFLTYTGKLIDFNNLKMEDIDLEDISHHLSSIRRYGGTLDPSVNYTVAEHCLNCYNIALKEEPNNTELHKQTILHDASEAYLGDVVTGLKNMLPDYRFIENKLEYIIRSKYIGTHYTKEIKNKVNEIDKRMFLTEAMHFMPERYNIYKDNSAYEFYADYKIQRYANAWDSYFNTCINLGITDGN